MLCSGASLQERRPQNLEGFAEKGGSGVKLGWRNVKAHKGKIQNAYSACEGKEAVILRNYFQKLTITVILIEAVICWSSKH